MAAPRQHGEAVLETAPRAKRPAQLPVPELQHAATMREEIGLVWLGYVDLDDPNREATIATPRPRAALVEPAEARPFVRVEIQLVR